jgi:SNF2 family DNA or RNA helicase
MATTTKSMNSSLLPHQSTAVDWCVKNEGGCCILAYDMGLGKTVISCAVIVTKPVKTLVVAPTALIGQWKSEIEKHTTGINVCIYHGSNRKYKSMREAVKEADVIISSPAVIANDIHNGIYLFRNCKRWIIDEAHKLRNSRTKIYKHLYLYSSLVENKIFLTGTPICNSCDDLISLICLSNLQYYNQQDLWKGISSVTKHKALSKIVDSIVLRRRKEDTIMDSLPQICTQVINLDIQDSQDSQQRETYNFFVNESLILRKILRMRQALNNHSQLLEELDELDSEEDIISIKLKAISNILQNIPKDDKVLIVSYFTKLLHHLCDTLKDRQPLIYHGGLTMSERNQVIDSFKNNSHNRILLMNLRAGGCGLNLTEANHVILIEPYWNNAEEQQAISRCYRLGQKKNVNVYKLVIQNSIESWLVRLQNSKQNVSNFLIEKCNLQLADIADEKSKLRELFRYLKDMKIDDKSDEELNKVISDIGL